MSCEVVDIMFSESTLGFIKIYSENSRTDSKIFQNRNKPRVDIKWKHKP